jgi:hypothetical protein
MQQGQGPAGHAGGALTPALTRILSRTLLVPICTAVAPDALPVGVDVQQQGALNALRAPCLLLAARWCQGVCRVGQGPCLVQQHQAHVAAACCC